MSKPLSRDQASRGERSPKLLQHNELPAAARCAVSALRFSPCAFLEISELDEIHAIALGGAGEPASPFAPIRTALSLLAIGLEQIPFEFTHSPRA